MDAVSTRLNPPERIVSGVLSVFFGIMTAFVSWVAYDLITQPDCTACGAAFLVFLAIDFCSGIGFIALGWCAISGKALK